MNKHLILPVVLVVFLILVFLDQNSGPAPVKLILGTPFHIPLSMIIIASMAAGAIIACLVMFMVIKFRTKLKKNGGQE